MLIPCPACERQISVEAEACPQCGHPNRRATRSPAPTRPSSGPTCYACRTPATTRCQACGKLSCAVHVNSIFVPHGKGGANELRCSECYSSAQTWKVIGWVVGVVILIIFAVIFLTQVGRFGRW